MARLFLALNFCLLSAVLSGCESGSGLASSLDELKIQDLAPALHEEHRSSQDLRVYTFRFTTENFNATKNIWSHLFTRPLKFVNFQAFEANGFRAGLGKLETWNKIARILRKAQVKTAKTTSLWVFDDKGNDVYVDELNSRRSIFYTSADGKTIGSTIGPGSAALAINVAKLGTARGVCKVRVQPIFRSLAKEKYSKEAGNRVIFHSVGFELTMCPGDFVFLGPSRDMRWMPLSDLFFKELKPRPTVKMYMILCRRITD